MESELAIDTCFEFLHVGHRDDNLPVYTTVQRDEIVQFEVHGYLAVQGDGVARLRATLKLTVEVQATVQRENALAVAPAGDGSQILCPVVLIFTR